MRSIMNRFTNCAPSSSVASEICTASPLSRRALLLAAVGCVPALAGAQGREFPQRPIRLVLGFPPGGAPDNSARLVAQKMAEGLGQPLVVQKRPGASGNIAPGAAPRRAPDGYTLFYTTSTIHGIN